MKMIENDSNLREIKLQLKDIELIECNCFGGLFYNDEYIKTLPIYDLIADGYTDKDIVPLLYLLYLIFL